MSAAQMDPAFKSPAAMPLRRRRRDGAFVMLIMMIAFQIDARPLAAAIPGYYLLRYSFVGLLMAILIVINWNAFLASMRNSVWFPLVVMNLYQIISALWSASMVEGLFFSIVCALSFLAAIAIGRVMSFGKILDIYVKSALFCTGLGALFAIAVPSIGVESKFLLAGDWRGLANQKNLFGYFAGVGFVITFLRATGQMRGIWRGSLLRQLAYCGFFLAMVLLSGSRGGLMMALFVLVVFFIANARLPRVQILGITFVLVTALVMVVSANLEIGVRGITLFGTYIDGSNRFLLWSYGLSEFGQTALVGYGRSGFWTSGRTTWFETTNGWVLENFHNGYITLLVEGGIIGFALFLVAFTLVFMSLVRAFVWFRGPQAPFAVAMFVGLLLYACVEAVFGRAPQLSVFLAFALVANVVEGMRVEKRRSSYYPTAALA